MAQTHRRFILLVLAALLSLSAIGNPPPEWIQYALDDTVTVWLPEEPIIDEMNNVSMYRAYGNENRDLYNVMVGDFSTVSDEYPTNRADRELFSLQTMQDGLREVQAKKELFHEFVVIDSVQAHIWGANATLEGLEWGVVACEFFRGGKVYAFRLLTDRMEANELRTKGQVFFASIEIKGADHVAEGWEAAGEEFSEGTGVQSLIYFGGLTLAVGVFVVLIIRYANKGVRAENAKRKQEAEAEQERYADEMRAQYQQSAQAPKDGEEPADDSRWSEN